MAGASDVENPRQPAGQAPPEDGKMRAVDQGLRWGLLAFSTLTFSLIAATRSNAWNVNSIAFAMSMGVIAFVYGATLLVLQLIPSTRDSLAQRRGVLGVLAADFVVLLLYFAAVCSAAFDLPIFCDARSLYTLFGDCGMITAGVSMGFFGAFALVGSFWLTLLGPLRKL